MMKFLLALALAMVLLFFCVACGSVVRENDDTEPNSSTVAQTQETDPTRIPYWAEGMDVNEEETISKITDTLEIRLNHIEELVALATDIVKVEALGEERVKLLNFWRPPLNGETIDSQKDESHSQAETTSTSHGDDLLPSREPPSFREPSPAEEERYREIIERYEKYDIFTVYRFRVLEVYQGSIQPGEEIEVMRQGGQLGRFLSVNKNWDDADNVFSSGDELVLFLWFGESEREKYTTESIPDWVPNPEEASRYIRNLPYFFLSTEQSIYRMMPGGRIENACPSTNLTLTTAELARIEERNFAE